MSTHLSEVGPRPEVLRGGGTGISLSVQKLIREQDWRLERIEQLMVPRDVPQSAQSMHRVPGGAW